MYKFLQDILVCPSTHAPLKWEIIKQTDTRIIEANAISQDKGVVYPIRNGIGVFLTADLQREDMWKIAESRVLQHLRENPDLESQLMHSPPETLNPADLFYRSMILEEQGKHLEAQPLREQARADIYIPEYQNATESQAQYILEKLQGIKSPVVDLASGQGFLVEKMLRQGIQVIATDFSVQVLQRNRQWYEIFGLYDNLSLIACDAQQMPFKNSSISVMTTHVGLPNIKSPGEVLTELRRIISGQFLAISEFYPDNNDENAQLLKQHQFLSFREETLKKFAEAGWQVKVYNSIQTPIHPTPHSPILNAGIDGLPVVPTEIESCTLIARG